MGRPLRFEVPGGFWHVTNRGVGKIDIFRDDFDRLRFTALLAHAVDLYGWRVIAYCLMNNHFHLFIQTLSETLSAGAKMIQEEYARGFNKKYTRVGHLFQGRFAAQVVDTESYGLAVARYIVRNPVRAGLVSTPDQWLWSSYRATAGIVATPAWLDPSFIYEALGAPPGATDVYSAFAGEEAADLVCPWDHVRHGSVLGSDDFADRILRAVNERPPLPAASA